MSEEGTGPLRKLDELRRSGQKIELSDVRELLGYSNEWWRVMFETAGLAMVVGDTSGNILAATPSFEKVFGYNEDELREIGGVAAMTHPDDMRLDEELFGEVVAGKRDHYQLEKRYYRKDGRLMWGRLTLLMLRGADDEPPLIVAMVQDVTETRQAQELADHLRTASLKRSQAIELNDSIVQGLVVAKMAFERGMDEKAHQSLAETLERARAIVGDLLGEGGPPVPGSLVRGEPTASGAPPPASGGGSIP